MQITQWKRGGQRAPHKPLLILYTLARCYRGAEQFISYIDVDKELKRLLVGFGPSRKTFHTEYPFWRLQNDGLWELLNAEDVAYRKSHIVDSKIVYHKDATKRELLKYNVHGGFSTGIHAKLIKSPKLIIEIAKELLDANFPQTVHEDLLQAVGLDIDMDWKLKRKRDPEFRDKVLKAYEYRCAVCGFDVRLGDTLIAIEAAHIKWHQAGGPDDEANGLALCSMHHKLFDRGAFTLDDSMKIKVSEKAHGTIGFNEWLMSFHGNKLFQPQRSTYYPEPQFIKWHLHEVFQEPARYSTD